MTKVFSFNGGFQGFFGVHYFFLIIFVVVPIIEIGLFIEVGSLIGFWPTLASAVLTAMAGGWLLRRQGLTALSQARGAASEREFPLMSVIDGFFLLIAGLLLLTPGFFTDAMGFALLVPPLRLAVARGIWQKIKAHGFADRGGHTRDQADRGPVIDGQVLRDDPPDSRPEPRDSDSPWNKS